MSSRRPFGIHARRSLVVVLVVLLVPVFAVLPAGAAPPPGGTSTVTLDQDLTNCLFTVNYSWSGFKGRNLVAEYVLVNVTGTSIDLGIAYAYDTGVAGASGGGSKTFQLTVGGTSPPTRFRAIGRLGKFDRSGQFKETVPDAERTVLGAFNTNCGSPITEVP